MFVIVGHRFTLVERDEVCYGAATNGAHRLQPLRSRIYLPLLRRSDLHALSPLRVR
jgi:hypothetical protein